MATIYYNIDSGTSDFTTGINLTDSFINIFYNFEKQ